MNVEIVSSNLNYVEKLVFIFILHYSINFKLFSL